MSARTVTAFTAGVATTTAVATLLLRRRIERVRDGFELDELTGLLTRQGWQRQVSVSRGQRTAEAVVVIADCNGLKCINDRYGHAAGDRLIAAAGRTLVEALGQGAIVARFGGDEFVALCDPNALGRLASSQAVTVEMAGQPEPVRSRLAIGASRYTGDLSESLHRADAAMYRNKRDRDAPVAMFDPVLDDTGLTDSRPTVRTRDLDPVSPIIDRNGVLHG